MNGSSALEALISFELLEELISSLKLRPKRRLFILEFQVTSRYESVLKRLKQASVPVQLQPNSNCGHLDMQPWWHRIHSAAKTLFVLTA
jgi:hypothetical protein